MRGLNSAEAPSPRRRPLPALILAAMALGGCGDKNATTQDTVACESTVTVDIWLIPPEVKSRTVGNRNVTDISAIVAHRVEDASMCSAAFADTVAELNRGVTIFEVGQVIFVPKEMFLAPVEQNL